RADVDARDVALLDLDLDLDGRDVLEDEDADGLGRGARLLGAHGGAGIEVARRDVPGERREDASVVEAGLGDVEERTGPVPGRPREDALAPLGLDLADR